MSYLIEIRWHIADAMLTICIWMLRMNLRTTDKSVELLDKSFKRWEKRANHWMRVMKTSHTD